MAVPRVVPFAPSSESGLRRAPGPRAVAWRRSGLCPSCGVLLPRRQPRPSPDSNASEKLSRPRRAIGDACLL